MKSTFVCMFVNKYKHVIFYNFLFISGKYQFLITCLESWMMCLTETKVWLNIYSPSLYRCQISTSYNALWLLHLCIFFINSITQSKNSLDFNIVLYSSFIQFIFRVCPFTQSLLVHPPIYPSIYLFVNPPFLPSIHPFFILFHFPFIPPNPPNKPPKKQTIKNKQKQKHASTCSLLIYNFTQPASQPFSDQPMHPFFYPFIYSNKIY